MSTPHSFSFSLTVITFSILIVFSAPTTTLAQGTLNAGAACIDITPEMPVKMSGYAGRYNGPELSKGVHDRLYARVTVFELSGKRLVILSSDLIGFYNGTYEYFCDLLMKEFSLQRSELILTGTHTHAGPALSVDRDEGHPNNIHYTTGLGDTFIRVIREAMDSMTPVTIGAGRGSSSIGSNRREDMENGQIRLGRNVYGPTDREVPVIKLTRMDGTPLSAIFAYATHATSLGPKNFQISGDVLGLAAQYVEQVLGPNLITANFAGASGDINPWWKGIGTFRTDNGFIPETQLMGYMLGTEVIHVFEDAIEEMPGGPIKTSFATIDLPAKEQGEEYKPTGGTKPMNISAARIGDIAVIGFGCEMLHEVGMAVKAGSPFPYTFLVTHCNGTSGYLPPAHLYKEGGYEIRRSPYMSEAADMVVKKGLSMLYALHGD